MPKVGSKNTEKNEFQLFLCYSCSTEIIDRSQRRCPYCGVILNPNDYINWRISWIGFLCVICLIPILITFFIVLFNGM